MIKDATTYSTRPDNKSRFQHQIRLVHGCPTTFLVYCWTCCVFVLNVGCILSHYSLLVTVRLQIFCQFVSEKNSRSAETDYWKGTLFDDPSSCWIIFLLWWFLSTTRRWRWITFDFQSDWIGNNRIIYFLLFSSFLGFRWFVGL